MKTPTIKPLPRHDEQARQDFVATWRQHLAARVAPGNGRLYRERLLPEFVSQHQREPENMNEVRELMEAHPWYQFWSAMQRRSQEMMWDSVIGPARRVHEDLVNTFQELARERPAGGTLKLDPNLPLPRYHAMADIHIQPGGYHTEYVDDDVAAGVLYETGLPIYIGGALGPDSDMLGQILVQFARERGIERPRRILDMGCAMGNSTLPWANAFPDAEIHAIDVAAPCLRYGHARAEARGVAVHFSQQNAEATRFPDDHFDLVVSHIMLHETSRSALDQILAESRRVLRPGGQMLHLDVPLAREPFDRFMSSWETIHNNEYFGRLLPDIDLVELGTAAGFAPENIELTHFDAGFSDEQRNYTDVHVAWPILEGVA